MVRTHSFLLLLALLAAVCPPLTAQLVDTTPRIFNPAIHTPTITPENNPLGIPVYSLGSPISLLIEFDEIAEDRTFFRYTLEHCNARWQPSGLISSEFLDGFNEGTIDDYEYSHGTSVHYVHYSLLLPNEDMRPLISGNYLLKIYAEDAGPDEPALQLRFMVSEDTAPVLGARTSANTDRGFRREWQQLSFAVDTERASVDDPFNDLTIMVSQNGRMDNERSTRQPLRVQGTKAIFENRQELIFPAGNEYRRFETVNLHYPGMGVESIAYSYPYYHMQLAQDSPRTDTQYLYDSTQHGRFLVRASGSDDSATEADYIAVHFSLDPGSLPQGSLVFLDGDLTMRRFDPETLMTLNPSTGLLERTLLLKQGSYNYQYLTLLPGAKSGSTAQIEGDKWQTVNEYLIKVYHRRRGERYDRLIGVGAAFSDQ